MASPSSFTARKYKFNVFASFHGPDVRKTLLSHIRGQFNRNGITMFDDQEIERSATIAPSLTKAIKESRISIVILSKKYASSSWCLDELVEILKCKETMGQIVMTIFYGVKPSDVRKQTGEFGVAFKKTCSRKTNREKQKWSKALKDVGNIAGEDFFRWNNEGQMVEKIAQDVSNKLNATPSRYFDGMVGLEAHLWEMHSLLDLTYDGAMMVGISGPAGIGKSTIARALHSQLSNKFQLTCFVDNLRGSYPIGLDEYGLKLRLQKQFLSNILNQSGTMNFKLCTIEKRLCDQRVLIILDDVNNIKQLEALAGNISWFGHGSRIVVTTENQELLQQHGINNSYHVGFPSREEALEILYRYAYRQIHLRNGFEVIAERIIELCGKLPLALRVVGSSLRGKENEEWEDVRSRLENVIDRDIMDVLTVSYENLEENEQTLFLHIAVFFNCGEFDLVKAMFGDGNLDVKRGLKILVNRSLIEISEYGERIVMHRLLQQVGRKAIRKQEPWNRQILMDANGICSVLENETGTEAVSGISFDISSIDEVCIGTKAFEKMPNLRFLKVYKRRYDGNDKIVIPEEMEFPRRVRLLHWAAYPNKCLPPRFHPEYLVKLDMKDSKLETLWDGIQQLSNLKHMDLRGSYHLKELPDLSNATNLETLELDYCKSLVQLPSSIAKLRKLVDLKMTYCTRLEVIPSNWDLASLDSVNITGTNITTFDISVSTTVSDLPCCMLFLDLSRNGMLKTITQLPTYTTSLNLSYSGIESISNDCIKGLHRLEKLPLSGCRNLTSLPELPPSLEFLDASDCESLETVFCPVGVPDAQLNFANCFKLGNEARRAIIQQRSLRYGSSFLPGRTLPVEFKHRAVGNKLSFPLSAFSSYKVCLVISPKKSKKTSFGSYSESLLCRRITNHPLFCVREVKFYDISRCKRKHLIVFHSDSLHKDDFKEDREIVYEFSSKLEIFDVIACGAQILTDETEGCNNGVGSGADDGDDVDNITEDVSSEESEDDYEGIENDGGNKQNAIGRAIRSALDNSGFWRPR